MEKTKIYTLVLNDIGGDYVLGNYSSYEKALNDAIKDAQDNVDEFNSDEENTDKIMIVNIDHEGIEDVAVLIDYENSASIPKEKKLPMLPQYKIAMGYLDEMLDMPITIF